MALAAVAPTPLYLEAARGLLVGIGRGTRRPSTAAAQAAREAVRPITDMRGSEAQRRHLAGVLTRRAIETALQRARGEADARPLSQYLLEENAIP